MLITSTPMFVMFARAMSFFNAALKTQEKFGLQLRSVPGSCKLMGEFVLCEVQNGKGRSDAVVWQKDAIYIFEFKMDGSAKEDLEQINSQNYPIAYKNDGRKIVKVGVNYSSTEKQLTEWVIE